MKLVRVVLVENVRLHKFMDWKRFKRCENCWICH